jgi:hypothetical protein
MLQIKDWVLITGIAIATAGWFCLPVGQEANPKRTLSLFLRSADAGSFVSVGFCILALGGLIVLVSLFIPRR